MSMDGLQRMLNFLNRLEDRGIHYFIERNAQDSLRVTLTVVGVRIEVVFYPDEMEFSYFKGNEDVLVDERELQNLIDENWS